MPRVDFKTKGLIDKWNGKWSRIQRDFKTEKQLEELEKLKGEIKQKIEEAEVFRDAAINEIENEINAIEFPEAPKRKFRGNSWETVEDIELLKYYSRIIQSKLAIADNDKEAFVKTLNDLASSEDKVMQQALVDNAHVVLSAARQTDERLEDDLGQGDFEGKVREQIEFASDSLIGPDAKELREEALAKESGLKAEINNVNMRHSLAQDSMNDVLARFNQEEYFHESAVSEDEKEEVFDGRLIQ